MIEIDLNVAISAARALLKAHREPNDQAAGPLVHLLRAVAVNTELFEDGRIGHDYEALVMFDGEQYHVDANNAFTEIKLATDTDPDVIEAFFRRQGLNPPM